ncbi:MAG: site-specific DNA-methyltransferase [Spirochaetaceae bacterium]|nr:site-specific DNA-methyltransferase [Spirochaetaceae bacterium]
MQPITIADPQARSVDLVANNLARLRALFPDAFTDGRVDFNVLRDLLGDAVDDDDERYGFNWHGKRRARRLALTPSAGTLRPCPEESAGWATSRNLMIEGDNLEVMKLLQRSYSAKVKMIYIDPPYNTGKDFIYPDNYKDGISNYLRITGQVDDDGNKLSSNTETSGRFHTSWLNMMYPRLKVARNLLSSDGVIFISIDENENARLRTMCDEIFGEECFIAELTWKKKSGGGGDVGSIVIDHEYIVCYGRTSEPKLNNDPDAQVTTSYNKTDADGRRYSLDRLDKQSLGYQESLDFPISGPDGRTYAVKHANPDHKVARWRWGKETVRERYDELVFNWPHVYTKNYEKKDGSKPRSLLVEERFGRTRTGKTDLKALFDIEVMDFPKPVRLMAHLLAITVNQGDIVMDFFAGSCPLGQAIFEVSEKKGIQARFILIQLPEPVSVSSQNGKNALSVGCNTVADIGRERLRRVAKRIRDNDSSNAGDVGFRTFKLDSSNIRPWGPAEDDLEQAIADHVDHVKEGRSEQDILYELLLKRGLDLCATIEMRELVGKRVSAVGDGALMACFARKIGPNEVEELCERMAEWHGEMSNTDNTAVFFRDSAFASDVVKTNCTEILRQRGIQYVRSI